MIHRLVADAIERYSCGRQQLVDVGCGRGDLCTVLRARFERCCGIDAVRYEGFPADCEFHQADLDAAAWAVPERAADVVTAVEVIEHLENPWAFMRRLTALGRAGALIVVTTPNQLSLLSLLTLIVKGRFSAFQDVQFPVHRTALLECDLRRAATASGLMVLGVEYTRDGRAPLTGRHVPGALSRTFPRAFSDNLALVARKP